jgi:hypothetical protein
MKRLRIWFFVKGDVLLLRGAGAGVVDGCVVGGGVGFNDRL